jgi:hypothetical protein
MVLSYCTNSFALNHIQHILRHVWTVQIEIKIRYIDGYTHVTVCAWKELVVAHFFLLLWTEPYLSLISTGNNTLSANTISHYCYANLMGKFPYCGWKNISNGSICFTVFNNFFSNLHVTRIKNKYEHNANMKIYTPLWNFFLHSMLRLLRPFYGEKRAHTK